MFQTHRHRRLLDPSRVYHVKTDKASIRADGRALFRMGPCSEEAEAKKEAELKEAQQRRAAREEQRRKAAEEQARNRAQSRKQ